MFTVTLEFISFVLCGNLLCLLVLGSSFNCGYFANDCLLGPARGVISTQLVTSSKITYVTTKSLVVDF